jgi:predicted nucleic acid-binding protein
VGEIAVVNASPLIFLSRGRHLEILQCFASRVLVPNPVALEIQQRGSDDISAVAIARTGWIEVVAEVSIPPEIVEWGLGIGESSVLALARQTPGAEGIIDDRAARRCASTLGIPVRGTLGIVLSAKQRGMIASARDVMDDLLEGGLYLSKSVLDAALAKVGE